jgi:hypothetical protein
MQQGWRRGWSCVDAPVLTRKSDVANEQDVEAVLSYPSACHH